MNWRTTLLNVAICFLISVIVLAMYDRFVRVPKTPKLATVDIAALFTEQQKVFADALTRPQSEAEKARLMVNAERFARALDDGLKAVQQECQCILIAKQALLSDSSVPDWTPVIRKRLGAKK